MMCLSCPPALHDIFHTSMARCSLFVLKVPINTNQLTNSLMCASLFHSIQYQFDVSHIHNTESDAVNAHLVYVAVEQRPCSM